MATLARCGWQPMSASATLMRIQVGSLELPAARHSRREQWQRCSVAWGSRWLQWRRFEAAIWAAQSCHHQGACAGCSGNAKALRVAADGCVGDALRRRYGSFELSAPRCSLRGQWQRLRVGYGSWRLQWRRSQASTMAARAASITGSRCGRRQHCRVACGSRRVLWWRSQASITAAWSSQHRGACAVCSGNAVALRVAADGCSGDALERRHGSCKLPAPRRSCRVQWQRCRVAGGS
jgi:hypothetical protein